MPKKHDPFAALGTPPPKKSFLSSLLNRDKHGKAAGPVSGSGANGANGANGDATAASSAAADTPVDYQSPFRASHAQKKEKVSDSIQDNYTPPDLQKKSKTPKDFTAGAKLNQEPSKSSRRFSLRNLFRSSKPEVISKEQAIKEEKEGARAAEPTSEKPADQGAAKAKAVADTEKQLLANEEPDKRSQHRTSSKAEAPAETTKTAAPVTKPEAKTDAPETESTADERFETPESSVGKPSTRASVASPEKMETATEPASTDKDEQKFPLEQAHKEDSTETNREATVVDGAIVDQSGAAHADVADAIDATRQKETSAATKDVQTEPVPVDRKTKEAAARTEGPSSIADEKASEAEPVEPASTVEEPKITTESSEVPVNDENVENNEKLRLNGNHRDVDIGAGASVKQNDLLKIAKSRVTPILHSLDSNAKKQQLTDEEYKEYKKQERQAKHDSKLQKLREKNDTKYTKQEHKYNTKIEQLKNNIADLEAKIASAKEQHKNDLEASKKKHEEALKQEEEKFESDKELLIKEHEQLKAQKEMEIEELIANQKKTKLDIKLLESKTSEFEAKSKLLSIDIAELEDKIGDKSTILQKLSKEYEAHQKKLGAATKEHDETTDKLTKEAAKQAQYDSIIGGEAHLKEINATKDAIKLYESRLATLRDESTKRKETYKSLQNTLVEQKKFEALLAEAKVKKEEEIKNFSSGKYTSSSNDAAITTDTEKSLTKAGVVAAPADIPKETVTEPEPPKESEQSVEQALEKPAEDEKVPVAGEKSAGAPKKDAVVAAPAPNAEPASTVATTGSTKKVEVTEEYIADNVGIVHDKVVDVPKTTDTAGVAGPAIAKDTEPLGDDGVKKGTGAAAATTGSADSADSAKKVEVTEEYIADNVGIVHDKVVDVPKTTDTAGVAGPAIAKDTEPLGDDGVKKVTGAAVGESAAPSTSANSAKKTEVTEEYIANGVGKVHDKIVDISTTTTDSGVAGPAVAKDTEPLGDDIVAAKEDAGKATEDDTTNKVEVVEESTAGGVGKVHDKIVDAPQSSSSAADTTTATGTTDESKDDSDADQAGTLGNVVNKIVDAAKDTIGGTLLPSSDQQEPAAAAAAAEKESSPEASVTPTPAAATTGTPKAGGNKNKNKKKKKKKGKK